MTTSHCRFFKRVEITVTIADKLLDFLGQLAGMRLAAIERGDFVSTTQCVLNLIWSSESGTAENENAHWCRCLLRE